MVNGVSAGGITYFTVAYVLAAVATVAVILRFVARWKTRVRADKSGVQTGIRADDWSIAASLPLYWALAVQANLWATKGKIGFPTRELSPGQLEYFFEVRKSCSPCHEQKLTATDLLREPSHLLLRLSSHQDCCTAALPENLLGVRIRQMANTHHGGFGNRLGRRSIARLNFPMLSGPQVLEPHHTRPLHRLAVVLLG